jgi:type I restriction enzyme, S subunit
MKKYPNYKYSGVEWLGEIPSEWESIKLKFLMQIRNGEGLLAEKITDYGEFEVIGGNGVLGLTDRYNVDGTTIAIGRVGAKCGNVHFLKRKVFVNDNAMIVKTTKKTDAEFLVLILDIMNLNNLSTSTAQPLLTSTAIKNQFVTIGSKEEQLSIVQFLDHKTNRIDRFIANRKKQIELLKEQKAGIINKAVTKGINPNAKMKDSGIEWIGEVPEYWEIWKIKHTSYVKGRIGWDGLRSDEFYENEYAFLVTGTDFINGIVNWKSCYQITKERYLQDKHIQLKEDDLLITKDGTIGKTAVVKGLIGYASLNSGVFVVRPLRKYISDFLYFILNSNVFTQFINITTTGTTILHLYQNIFEIFEFTIPPIQEQQDIVDYIKEESEIIDTLISKYQKQIDLMQEYRRALISQAVTGKIDVRDWKPKAKKHKTEAMPVGMAAEKTEAYE